MKRTGSLGALGLETRLTWRAASAFASLELAASSSALTSASFFSAARSLCTVDASSCFSSPLVFLSSCTHFEPGSELPRAMGENARRRSTVHRRCCSGDLIANANHLAFVSYTICLSTDHSYSRSQPPCPASCKVQDPLKIKHMFQEATHACIQR